MSPVLVPPGSPSGTFTCSFPSPAILVVTISRPKQMNSIPLAAHWEGETIFQWYDDEPSLRVAIITGAGAKAFCAGQDLIEQSMLDQRDTHPKERKFSPGGFAGISRRQGKKPVIAAVNGFALGGGFEICLNCDMIVAAPNATFGLPETSVGVYAAAGGLPRLIRTCGLQVASQIALTGKRLSAQEAQRLNTVNVISRSTDSVLDEAIGLANMVAAQSPDAVIVTKHGLKEAWETASVERACQITAERFEDILMREPNRNEGLVAFAQKKKPQWRPSKL